MAAAKPDLARAGTMQVTAKEGANFLDRNLTEWKKPYLTDHLQEEQEENGEEEPETSSKPKMAKHTTMKTTAKEAEQLLAGTKPDDDALTRGQQKKIEEINAEKPAAKKAKLAKGTTMVATAKEAKALLGGEKLADTRQETSKKRKAPKRVDTISQTKAEAEAVFGKLDTSEGRSLRKRPEKPKPAPMKKAGTMQKTAKEGKAFLKRSKKAAKKEEKIEEEEEEEAEDEEDQE